MGLLKEKLRCLTWILPLVHVQFFFAACCALVAPFYPPLAESKGISATTYGYVFSAFKFGMLLGSLSSDYIARWITVRNTYKLGIFLFFLSQLLISILYWLDNFTVFIILSYVILFFAGYTSMVYAASMYGSITERFLNKAGLAIACSEFLWGAGNMVGSVLGGYLVDLWAFPLPFFTIPVLLALSLPIIFWRGPIPDQKEPEDDDSGEPQMRYYKLFLHPIFLIDMITISFTWIVSGFNEPTLSPYLVNTFGLNATALGVVFMIQFASYSVGALIAGGIWYWGYIEYYLLLVQACSASAFILIGPISFVPLEPSLVLVYASQVLTGVSMAGQFVGGFAHALQTAVSLGYPNDIRTTTLISSWSLIFLVTGATVMPPIASNVVSALGYKNGLYFIMVPLALWTIPIFIVILRRMCCSKSVSSGSKESIISSQKSYL